MARISAIETGWECPGHQASGSWICRTSPPGAETCPSDDRAGEDRAVAIQEGDAAGLPDVEVDQGRVEQLAVEKVADHEVIRCARQRRLGDERVRRYRSSGRRDREGIGGARGDVVSDHLDPGSQPTWHSAPGRARRSGIEVDQRDLAGTLGDLSERQIVAVAGTDDQPLACR